MSELESRHYLANGEETKPDAREAIEWATETRAQMVDLKFCDLLGAWQHMTLPLAAFDESAFDEGLGFDGSSIRGWQGIAESDMLLMPDPGSAVLDPFTEAPTLSLVCEILDPVTGEPYSRDPRRLAGRAEQYLRETGIADTAHFGPECEFFVFDSVSYDLAVNRAHYEVDSGEGHWNSGMPGLGYTIREKEGYFPPAPHDTLHDLRTEMVLTLERLGIPCEFHHHEVASGGQCEIDLRYQPLLRMADQVMAYKYVVRNVARRHGKTATFMPKPIFGDNGSGMHTHQSLWKEGTPLMADKSGYAGLSHLGRAPATRGSPTWGGRTSPGCSPTRRRCSPSARRPRTRTAGSCRATRPPSTSSTRSATARPASAFRSTRSPRRQSGSSSAAPTQPPIPTSPSRRC